VVADIEGYVYPATGTRGLYQPLQPARLADTRPGSGEPYAGQTPGPRGLVTVQVAGQGGVPATGVSAVVLNVTVTGPTSVGYLTVYPTAAATPLASNLNFVPGQTVANRVIVPLGSNGRVTFYNSAGSTQVIADVSGWFSDGSSATVGGSQFTPTSPSRIADTRVGSGEPFAFNTLTPGSTVAIQVAGVGPVPAMSGSAPPRAVVLNVTATNTTAPGFVSVFPDGTTQPNASDVNWNGGATVPNLVIAKLGSDGAVDFYNNAGAADLVVDLMGWYS